MSSKLAAMLADASSSDTHEDMMAHHSASDTEDLGDSADEGQMVACEEIMQAFHDQDSKALLDALRSFIHMAN